MINVGEIKEVYKDLDELTFRTRQLLVKCSDWPNSSVIPCETDKERQLLRHLEFLRGLKP